ncbi:T9SS type A sorting domain-containing protein [Labilibacter sediminis]|nr:T9SS type A sorting domain-containing protein [Labilibacter sediminis]
MKRLFTLLSICGVLLSTGAFAQTDITPSRYRFTDQPTGAFSIDKTYSGWNVPASDADVVNHWNNGFISASNPDFPIQLAGGFTGNAATYNSCFQVFDMGGQVGKVLMIKGGASEFPYGVAGTSGGFNAGHSLNFYTHKDHTTAIATGVANGLSEEEAKKQATVRMRLVFHMHQNVLNTATDNGILGYSYTNDHKVDEFGAIQDVKYKSGDFADVVFDEETEEEVLSYNPNKWIAVEYDHVANEEDGMPLRFAFRMKWGQIQNATLLIKEISFTANPTGAPVEREELTLVSNVSTSISPVLQKESLDCYGAEGQLVINNVNSGEQVMVYSLAGQLVNSSIAQENQFSIPMSKGIYIVKVGVKTGKVVIQ